MMVHRHPVFQKVIIGVFVWGMLIFGIHVANGQMQFPTGDMMGPPPGGIPNFTFPSDMPQPPTNYQMPATSVPLDLPCTPKGTAAAFVCAKNGRNAMPEREITYFNACDAQTDGATIVHDGICAGQEMCASVADPVCGNDGKTWVARCYAIQNGGGVKHEGQCTTASSGGTQPGGNYPMDFQNFGGGSAPGGQGGFPNWQGGPASGGVQRPGEPSNPQQDVNRPNGIPGAPGMPDIGSMMSKGEEARRAGEAQGLAQMKKGAKSMDRVIKTVQGKVDALKAKGGVVSETLLKGLADYAPASAAMQAATSIVDAQAQFEIMQEVMDMLQDELPKLEMSANLPKIFKQVEKEYTKLVNAVKKQRSKLTAVKEQLAEKIAELDTNVAAIRAAIDEAKAPGVAPDVAIETLQDKAFDKFEETWQIYASLEALRAMKATMTKVATQIKANDRLIAKIKKVDEDIAAELAAIQVKIRANYDELKAMPNTTDPDTMFEKLSLLADLQQSFEDTVIGSQDDGDVTNDKLSALNNWGVPQFAPPSGFPGSAITDVNSLKSMQNIAPFMPKK